MAARNPVIAALACAALFCGCGGDPPAPSTTTVALPPSTTSAPPAATTTTPTTSPTTEEPPVAEQPPGPAETASDDPRINALERRARATVAAYVRAIDERDGARICALLALGTIEQVALPRPRASCAASVDASLGYRDPRGLPVWSSSQATAIRVAELDGAHRAAKVIATVLTTYSDRDEGSVEDDVVYLVRSGAGWLVAKPSATLYRAVGVADVPPTVLAPPG